MDKKKLLFVTSTLETGGVSNVLSNLTLQLKDKYDITILLNDTEKIAFPYGGEIVSLGMSQQDDRTKLKYQTGVFLKRYRRLKKLKKSGEFYACISMLDSANIANLLTGKKYCKVITTVYTNISASKDEKFNKYIIIPAIKYLYNRSDVIVITSEGVKRDLAKNYRVRAGKMRVIYDGVDIEQIRENMKKPIAGNKSGLQNKEIISSLGRLDNAKAQWHMIRAMKKVVGKYPSVRLLIMGPGILEGKLKELVNECGLRNNIEICGFTENPYQYIASSKMFILSSVVEGYPTVLLEALVCGVPCVCTDFNSGGREILAPDTDVGYKQQEMVELAEYGILTPVCDGIFRSGGEPLTKEEELFADGILTFLEDEELREEYIARIRTYSDRFSIKMCADAWIDVIES